MTLALFVWTLGDAVGLGLLALFFLACLSWVCYSAVCDLIDKLKRRKP